MDLKSSIDRGPETEIVDYLCDRALVTFSVNKEFLYNWNAELSHELASFSFLNQVAQEIILLFPKNGGGFDTSSCDALQNCLTMLDELNDDVYYEFKILIYTTIYEATTSLYSSKAQLFRFGFLKFLVKNIISYVEAIAANSTHQQRAIFVHKKELAMSFMELGCDATLIKQLIAPVLSRSSQFLLAEVREFHLQIISSAIHYQSVQASFLVLDAFTTPLISLPFNHESPLLNNFTLCSWFKTNSLLNDTERSDNELSRVTLFLLASSQDPNSIIFKIQLVDFKKFVMMIHSPESGGKMSFTFNVLLDPKQDKNQGFTHLVLTYDLYQNLNLFVDGEYCESIPCPSLAHYPCRWNKLYIGTLPEEQNTLSPFSRCEFVLTDLSVIDLAIPYEWICFFYGLGAGYDWSYKEFTETTLSEILGQMQYKKLTMLELKLQDMIDEVVRSTSYFSSNAGASNSSSAKGLQAHGKNRVLKALMQTKLKRTNFLFDIYSCDLIYSVQASLSATLFYHQTVSIYDSLFALGGGSVFLVALENVIKDKTIPLDWKNSLVLRIVDDLLLILKNHPILAKEFQEIEGYWILLLMINYYKANYNRKLQFVSTGDLQKQETQWYEKSAYSHIISCFLDNFLVSQPDCAELFISNLSGYKLLVLDFDFYLDTVDFPILINHIRDMLDTTSSQIKDVCGKIRASSKLCQALRRNVLIENSSQNLVKEFDVMVRTLLDADPSAEAIRSFAEFVILALYVNSNNSNSKQLGLNVLRALIDKFCDARLTIKEIRKFSRSMSIYWILLLFEYQGNDRQFAGQVVCSGITLLAKLLKVLGATIIRKFIKLSKGLDVLTHCLKDWWSDDRVAAHLLASSLEADMSILEPMHSTVYQIIDTEEFATKSHSIALPEFLLLLNNIALVGGYTLAQKQGQILSAPNSPLRQMATPEVQNCDILNTSLDWLHSINRLSSIVVSDHSQSAALRRVFFSKEWLESAFEIVAYLKLLRVYALDEVKISFVSTQEKFISALCSIFVTKLLDIKLIVSMVNSVNDVTAKLVFEYIFPRLFEQLIQFTFSSQFIFQEADLIRGTTSLLEIYYGGYVQQNFKVVPQDLELFLNCVTAVLERKDTPLKTKRYLGPIVGRSIIIKLSIVPPPRSRSGSIDGGNLENSSCKQLDENAKYCLYKQSLFLQSDIISDETLHQVVVLVMGHYLKLTPSEQLRISEHVLNFIRTSVMMRSDSFDWIIDRLIEVSDYKNSKDLLKEFFDNIVTKNDEDTIRYLQKFPTIKQIFNRSWQFRMRKLEDVCSLRIIEMVQVVLGTGGLFGSLSTAHIEKFRANSNSVKATCINDELMKFGRQDQDKQEAEVCATSAFGFVKSEVRRVAGLSTSAEAAYTLHYTEGVDRMRKLLILEDDVPECERLSYTVSVPSKAVSKSAAESVKGLNIPFLLPKKSDSVLETSFVDMDLDEYEEIDETGELESLSSNFVYEDRNRKVLRSLYMGDQIQNLFNVSRIQGLDSVESLMILGYTHVYLIEHCFHCSDGNVIDVEDAPRDLRDPYIQLIKPTNVSGSKAHRSRSWPLETMSCISRRKFLLRDIGLEMFFSDGASILITSLSTKHRDAIFSCLSSYATGKGLDKDLAATLEISSSPLQIIQEASTTGSFLSSKFASAFSTSSAIASKLLELTQKWKEGKMSNFFYLMAINTMAGRTFNDLSQYPVFPWVIADYESESLDFDDPKSFRDLSKPMGAQTKGRANQFQDRFEALKSFEDPNSPAFHYGTHYSSAMIVSSYLIRMRPFVQSYLLLQGGTFDHADRLFNSIQKAWISASRDNTTDVRELTPEFFYLPEFLVNLNHFEFGKLQNGKSVNDVELPKWAKGDPKVFITKNREALESPYVSQNLHRWIDLIFGYKQNGTEAVKALNVFHHLSYEGAINLEIINDEVEKRAIIGMINNFGQTPLKLFSKPHPSKEVFNLANKYLVGTDLLLRQLEQTFESSLHLPIKKIEFSNKTSKWIGRPACISSEEDILLRKPDEVKSCSRFGNLFISNIMHVNIHLAEVTAVLQTGNKQFLTASADGIIKEWKCLSDRSSKIALQHVLRGHLYPVRSLTLNKSFNVCLSLDSRGGLIVWDLTRSKFVKQVVAADKMELQCKRIVSVSNDTGNFCVLSSSKFANTLTVYTLNGEVLCHTQLEPGEVTTVAFAQVNTSLIDEPKSEYPHIFWSSEFLTVSYCSPRKILRVYEISCGSLGHMILLSQVFDMSSIMSNSITATMVIKETTFDDEERLTRGRLAFVIGDSKGRVLTY